MLICYPRPCHELEFCASQRKVFSPYFEFSVRRKGESASKGSMSRRRGRPHGPAPPSADGGDSEELDNPDMGTAVQAGSVRHSAEHLRQDQGGEGRERKHRIGMRGHMDVFDSNEMRWASCCGVSFCGCNDRLCEVYGLFREKKFPPFWGGRSLLGRAIKDVQIVTRGVIALNGITKGAFSHVAMRTPMLRFMCVFSCVCVYNCAYIIHKTCLCVYVCGVQSTNSRHVVDQRRPGGRTRGH